MASEAGGCYRSFSDTVSFIGATYEIEDNPPQKIPHIPPEVTKKANDCAQKLLRTKKVHADSFQIQIKVSEKQSTPKFFGFWGSTTTLIYKTTLTQRQISFPIKGIIDLANAFFQKCALPDDCTLTLFFK